MNSTPAKPDLALIHGWGLGQTVWQPVLPALAQRFNVHLLALPGYDAPAPRANSQPAVERMSDTTSFAQAAEMLIEALPDNCVVCGWSLGGMLAIQAAVLAAQHDKPLNGLVLVGSTPSFARRVDWAHGQEPTLLDTFNDAVAKDAAGTLQRFIALLNQGDAQARALGRTMIKLLQQAQLPTMTALLTGLGWLRDVDLREQLAAVEIPALLVHGENDPLMPLSAARWLNEQLPDSTLEVFTGAAHAPFLNDTERFAQRVGDFFHAPSIA